MLLIQLTYFYIELNFIFVIKVVENLFIGKISDAF